MAQNQRKYDTEYKIQAKLSKGRALLLKRPEGVCISGEWTVYRV